MLNNETKKEIKKIVDSELKAYEKKSVDMLKNDEKLRKHIVDIIRTSMSDLFKTLWMRRSTWENEIGRK